VISTSSSSSCTDYNNGGRWKGYTSTRLTTKDKKDFQNGAWEARLVFWAGGGADGVWPAFWLLGSNVNEQPYPGPTCWPLPGATEVDVFEFTMNDSFLNQSKIITNFIQGSVCQQGQGNRLDLSVNAYAWHTYRVETKDGTSSIYVDGNWQRSVGSGPWQNQNMHAILNVAIGGNLGGPLAWPGGAWAGKTVDYVKHESWW
jgi:beta-glucanase (GH16 family)